MADKADTVFISYRRKSSKHPALLVFKDLHDHGYDVFIDYESIDSGKFGGQILNQIASRRNFIVILSPGCLDRTADPGDWLRREIEYAIEMQRNVVPVLFDDFTFESARSLLTGKLSPLEEYNGLTVPDGYFDPAMTKLRTRFLKQPVKGIVKPVAKADSAFVLNFLQKANDAAGRKEFQLASQKYSDANAATSPSPFKTPKPASAKQIAQVSQKEKPAPPDRELASILRRTPLPGEVVHLNESANIDVTFLTAHEGRIILTNKRLIYNDLLDTIHSFEIPMSKLRASKFRYFNVLDINRFTIHTPDGAKYNLVVPEVLRYRIENKVRELLAKP